MYLRQIGALQSAVDGVIASTGAQVMPAGKSRAAFIDGYGIIVDLEIAFDAPQGIFNTPKKPAEVRTLVARRRKDLQEKMTAFVKSHVATTDSIGGTDSLAIVIYVLNTNPADIPEFADANRDEREKAFPSASGISRVVLMKSLLGIEIRQLGQLLRDRGLIFE